MNDSRKSKAQLIEELQTLRNRVRDLEQPTPSSSHESRLLSLQGFIATVPIGLCLLDTDLRFVHINEWLAAINGLSVEEHLGRRISELLPNVAAGVEPQLRHVIETGEATLGETVEATTLAHPHGQRHFQHNYSAVRSNDGTVIGVSCVVQDISERKQAEQNLRLTQFALDHAADAIYWVREDARLFYVNQAAVQTLGYSRDELLSMSVTEFDPNFPQAAWPEHWQEMKDVDCLTFESQHRTKEGHVFPVEITTQFLEYESDEFVWAYVRDITERKRSEDALKKQEEHFRLFSLSTGDCFWNWDMVAGTVERSSGLERSFGYQEQEVLAGVDWWRERIHPEDKKGV